MRHAKAFSSRNKNFHTQSTAFSIFTAHRCFFSVRYREETVDHHRVLNLGCQGRVLLYNTQPLRYTSQPLFTSELAGLPLHPLEKIVDLCHVETERAIGLLSARCFILWQYSHSDHIRLKFCNSYNHPFNRCYSIARFRLLILTFDDGLLHIYQLPSMQQLRHYQKHWKPISSLVTSHEQKYLLTSSTDHRINIWNLGESPSRSLSSLHRCVHV